jgi:3-keto-L-gulonate-6-phosphate decarboxylase
VLRARVPNINKAIKTGADIRVVGWTITISKDINYTAEGFIEILDRKRSTSSGL